MGMIACSDCGEPIGANALFCPKCGSAAGLFNMIKRFLIFGTVTAISVFAALGAIALIIFFFVKNSGG